MLFDTHAHYYDQRFDEDRDEILSSMNANNVGWILNAGCDILSTKQSIAISQKYDFCYASSGIHPNHVVDITKDDLYEIKELANHEKVKAIGEIGLDYNFCKDNKDFQKKLFSDQINIAKELDLPFIIHSREACGDCLDILKAEYSPEKKALWHCFSESKETAKIVLDMGIIIAIGGTVTFKNNVRTVEAAKYIPLDRLVIETDSPYLAPTPHRGERNSSLYIHLVAEKIAEIKGIDVSLVERITAENAKKLFDIEQ